MNEILDTLHKMNKLFNEAKKQHKQLVDTVRQAREMAYELDSSGEFDEDVMNNFMDQLDVYESNVAEGLEESPVGMLKDTDLI